jgi:hypothetical protein
MRGRGKRVAVFLLAIAAGCYWQKYPRLVETHVDLLAAMAVKSEDVLRERGGYRPEQLAEFRYPYDRARDFARIVRDRYEAQASFQRFEKLLDRYQTLLSVVNRLNAARDPASLAELAKLVNQIHEDRRAVLAALRAEGPSAG